MHKIRNSKLAALLLVFVLLAGAFSPSFASAYNAQPKLIVILVIDQLRADMLERFHDRLRPDGFRVLLDHGAWYTNCYYDYANTETAPGHATIGAGTYTLGHGIMANEWFDPRRGRRVSSVEDDATTNLGAPVAGISASPRNLLTDTIGDELKLATGGQARVFGVSLKDRAAILPVGFSANAAYWIDHESGAWITSSYYMTEAPAWVVAFNQSGNAAKYLNREWKDAEGRTLLSTAPAKSAGAKPDSYYNLVGPTPFANDYTYDFVRALIENEQLGSGPATDLLSISISSHDILGHKFGPDSIQEREMDLAMDRQLADFLAYLNQRLGPGNYVVALTADHGIAPLPDFAQKLRIPAFNFIGGDMGRQLNANIAAQLAASRPAAKQPTAGAKSAPQYILEFAYPKAFLNAEAFAQAKLNEEQAERMVGDALVRLGLPGYVTKSDLAAGHVPNTVFARQLRNSYSPLPGWYVFGLTKPFVLASASGTSHGMPFAYDAHVPLAFYGPGFKPGVYRQPAQPTDLAVTLSSLLGINKPASATGRVLVESLQTPVLKGEVRPAANAAPAP